MPNELGRGFGFRGWAPPWPFVGRGRGGLPRCWSYIEAPYPYYPTTPEQEQAILRSQAETLRKWAEEIERRIKDLEAKS